MGDFLDKYAERGLVSYLDSNDNIEAILPGPSERERNESRLREIVTGEGRPLSHKAKEATALVASNVVVPILAGALKGASVASKAVNGVRLINKIGKPGVGRSLQQSMKKAAGATEKYAKKTAKEAAEKMAETKGDRLFTKLRKWALAGKNPSGVAARAAKKDAKDVKKAIEIINKNPMAKQLGDMIYDKEKFLKSIVQKDAIDSGLKTAVATGAGVKAGNVIANGGVDTGDYNPLKEDVKGYDNRFEMSKLRKIWQFIKGLFDLDDLNPDIYPMDQVNYLVDDLFDNKHIGTSAQKGRLGDDEKIKLIMDTVKGIYDTDDTAFSYELYKNYMNMIDEEEEDE